MHECWRLTRTTMILGGFCLAAAVPAGAGVIGSPLPTLSASGRTAHVFTVPGVIKDNNLETLFTCTSLETSRTLVFAVEVFDGTGAGPLNNAATPTLEGAKHLAPGETATIATGHTLGLHEDKILTSLLPASLKSGSARIVSTSKHIACTVLIADDLNDPPASMVALKVISKKKQRGE